jgi:hypothetical protein
MVVTFTLNAPLEPLLLEADVACDVRVDQEAVSAAAEVAAAAEQAAVAAAAVELTETGSVVEEVVVTHPPPPSLHTTAGDARGM